MSKSVKAMAPMCSIDDEDCRDLAEEHGFGVGEEVSRKVYFVLGDPPYNLRRDQADDHVEYDVFGSVDMKYMAKFLAEAMKPAAHEHVLCSAL